MHCIHQPNCPVCQSAEVRRLSALFDAERARSAQLERAVSRLERELRAAEAKLNKVAR